MKTLINLAGSSAQPKRSVRENFRAGATLIEVVVFLSLALAVLGGTFPLLSRLMVSDKATEEWLAAYLFLQTAGEELKEIPYNTLTNGYTQVSGHNYYETDIGSTNFYKTIQGRFRKRLYPQTSSEAGDYYQARLILNWDTKINGLPKKRHQKTIILLLMPDA